ERVVLERIWRYVGKRLTLSDVLVAQLFHVVELGGEQWKRLAIGIGGYGDGSQSEVCNRLIVVGSKPSLGDRNSVLNGGGESAMPFADRSHGFDTRFEEPLGEPWIRGCGWRRSIAGRAGESKTDLVAREGNSAMYGTRQRLEVGVGPAVD